MLIYFRDCRIELLCQEGAPKELANSELRRILAYIKSFNRTDVNVGDSAPLYKAVNLKCTPRRRGPTRILDFDGAGVVAEFPSQTFVVARYCVRKRAEGKDSGEVD